MQLGCHLDRELLPSVWWHMRNEEIAQIFEKMARLLSFRGRDRFRIMAYERAAVSLRDLEEDLAEIAARGELEEFPG